MIEFVELTGTALQRANRPDGLAHTYELTDKSRSYQIITFEKHTENDVILNIGYNNFVLVGRQELIATVEFICENGLDHGPLMAEVRKLRDK